MNIVLTITWVTTCLAACIFVGGIIALTQKDNNAGFILLVVSGLMFVPCGRVLGWW
jgi:hypothetical protein